MPIASVVSSKPFDDIANIKVQTIKRANKQYKYLNN